MFRSIVRQALAAICLVLCSATFLLNQAHGQSSEDEENLDELQVAGKWGPECVAYFQEVHQVCTATNLDEIPGATTSCEAWTKGALQLRSAMPPDVPAESFLAAEEGCSAGHEALLQVVKSWPEAPEQEAADKSSFFDGAEGEEGAPAEEEGAQKGFGPISPLWGPKCRAYFSEVRRICSEMSADVPGASQSCDAWLDSLLEMDAMMEGASKEDYLAGEEGCMAGIDAAEQTAEAWRQVR